MRNAGRSAVREIHRSLSIHPQCQATGDQKKPNQYFHNLRSHYGAVVMDCAQFEPLPKMKQAESEAYLGIQCSDTFLTPNVVPVSMEPVE